MKQKFNLFNRCLLLLVAMMTIGVGSVWGGTYSVTPDASTTGSSATTYSTLNFTSNGVEWAFYYTNPNTLQIKTNQSSSTSEFYFYNKSAFAGKITQVVIKFSALTISDASKLCFVGGTSVTTNNSGGSAGTWNKTDQTLTWTPAANTNYTFFRFYQNGEAASGTNNLASADAIVVTYSSGKYAVVYDLSAGATPGATHPDSAAIGSAFAVSAPIKDGNTFAGWTVTSSDYTKAKWGTTSTPSSDVSSSTVCVNGATGDVYFKDLHTVDKSSVTLTANWQAAKEVSSIVISGTPTKTVYTAGETFDPTGLTVTANYTSGDPETITSGIQWSFIPNGALTTSTTSISVQATALGKTSEAYLVDMTVNAAPQTVTFSADSKADVVMATGSSNLLKNQTLSAKGITMEWSDGKGSSSSYHDGTVVRFYQNNTFTLTPATGVTITKVEIVRSTFTSSNTGVINCSGLTASSDNTTTNTNVYSGSTTSTVTFTASAQARFTSVKVYYSGKKQDEVHVTGIELSETTKNLEVGTSFTLIPIISPDNADNKKVTWEVTSGSSFVSVTSDGVVTGNAVGGPATVKCTTEDGGFTATCTVNVIAELPKVIITADQITSFTTDYKQYDWSANNVAGKIYAYKSNGMQFNNNTYVYNTSAIPGRIVYVSIVKSGSNDLSWSVYGANESITSSSEGTQIGTAQKVDENGATWYVPDNENYKYFYITKPSGATQIAKFVIAYEQKSSAVTFSNPENGTLVIKKGDNAIASGDAIVEGTKLTVTAAPTSGAYRLDSIRVIKSGSDPVEDVTASVYDKSTKQITMPTYAITVSAVMEANNYLVTFHKNTAPAEDDYTQTFTYTVAKNMDANKFTAPKGYEFFKWAETAEGEGVYGDKAEYILSSEANADLYAKWTPKNIYVTLDKNGSSADGLASINYDATAVDEIVHAAAWAEHTLTGYFTAASAGEKVLNADGTFAGNVAGWIENGKWAMDKDTTLYAQWNAVSKYNISYDLTGCTADAGNPKEIALSATSVTLNFTLVSDLYTWTDDVVYVTMGGAEMTDFTFTDGALVITPTYGFTADIAVGIICDYAPATLTLSALGNEYSFGDDLQVNDKVTLPSDVSVKASGKTFVGWSSVTIETAGDKPTSNYWAKGAEYSISSTADKLYAVYATEEEGEITWSVATGIDDLSANDKIAFACLNGTVSVANGGKTGTNNYLDTVNITVDNNNVVTAGAERIVPITLGGDATAGWTMFMKDYGYIAGSYAVGSDGKLKNNTLRFSDDPVTVQDFFINTPTYEATLTVANDSVLKYNSNSPRFSVYSTGQTTIKILKASQAPSEFSKYTTSGTLHVDAPTFDASSKPGTFTEAQLVILNVPAGTEVRYTTNGDEPTKSSTLYDEEDGIEVDTTTTIKAKAFIGENASELLEGTFTIHNYNTVADLIAGAEHNKAAVLNMNDVFVLGVYSLGKQIFVQEGTKGVILTLTESVPKTIVAGVKLTAKASGTYIYTANNRPQLNACTLSNVSVSGEDQRPATIPVLDKIDESTAADNLLTLVQINNVYSISKSGNDIVMNSASDESGTSFNVNNLLGAVKSVLPEQKLACNVIGIFYKKKASGDVEEYSLMPVLESDFALVGATPDAVLPTVSDAGSTDSENPAMVAKNKVITITKPAAGFTGKYTFNGTETTMTASSYEVTITNETTADVLTLTSTRPYYNDKSITYYYKADPALNEYAITYPSVQTYVTISGAASAIPGTTVQMTGAQNVSHYYPGVAKVYYVADPDNNPTDTTWIDVNRTEVSKTEATYSFTMPTHAVVVKMSYTKDPTFAIDYQTGGKQTTGGTKPTEGNKYEGDSVSLATNTWTTNNYIFKEWRVVYIDGDTTDVAIKNNKFAMPAHDVKIIAQWTPVYAVTYDKGSATSATGSVTENPQVAGAEITIKANAFKATGYTFTGWKASTDGNTYQPGDKFTIPAEAVTFTAQWDGAEYTKEGNWQLVTSADQLVADKYYVMVQNAQGMTATNTINTSAANQYIESVESTFSTTKDSITALGDGTAIFQLGGATDAWTLWNVVNEKYLIVNKPNKDVNPAYADADATKWNISVSDNNSILKYGTYDQIKFNTGGNRFKPYSSTTMLQVQLYRFYRAAFKVTYDANGGETAPEVTLADPDTKIAKLSSTEPTRTGYTFTGWTETKGGTGDKYQAGDNFGPMTKNVTLYAQWSINQYNVAVASVENVTLNAKPYGESDITEGNDADVNYNKSVVLTYTDLSSTHVFKSWKVTKADDNQVEVEVIEGQSSTTFNVPDFDVVVSAVIEEKATAKVYLTYDGNGGTLIDPATPEGPIEYNYGTTINPLAGEIYHRDNCIFTGWNSKPDGTGSISRVPGGQLTITEDVTLYAQWQATGVTYHLNKVVEGKVEITSGEAPAGSSFVYVQDNSTLGQATVSYPNMTLTLSGYDGKIIKGVIMKMHTNKASGAGSITVTVGDNTLASTTYLESFGDYDQTTYWRIASLAGFHAGYVADGQKVVIQCHATESSLYLQDITIQYATADYVRSNLTIGRVSTVCVPYAVKPEDRFGAGFYEIAYKTQATDDQTTKIYFDEVDPNADLVAGKPYVMIPEQTSMALYYSGDKVDEPVAGNKGLTGTFSKITDGAAGTAGNVLENNYIFNNNMYWLCQGKCWLDANRAYIDKEIINASCTPVSPAPGRRRIVLGNADVDTPTNLLNAAAEQGDEIRKIVIDNQMYIIRGGKMYNAAGALVK